MLSWIEIPENVEPARIIRGVAFYDPRLFTSICSITIFKVHVHWQSVPGVQIGPGASGFRASTVVTNTPGPHSVLDLGLLARGPGLSQPKHLPGCAWDATRRRDTRAFLTVIKWAKLKCIWWFMVSKKHSFQMGLWSVFPVPVDTGRTLYPPENSPCLPTASEPEGWSLISRLVSGEVLLCP